MAEPPPILPSAKAPLITLLIRQSTDLILPPGAPCHVPLLSVLPLLPSPPFQAYVSDEDNEDSSECDECWSESEYSEDESLTKPPLAGLSQGSGLGATAYHDPGARLQALSLFEYGVPLNIVAVLTSISERH